MKETVLSRDDLFQALRTAGPLLKGRKTASRIRLRSEDGDLALFASDGRASVHVKIADSLDNGFDFDLPHRSLSRLIRAAGGELSLDGQEEELLIHSGRRQLRLKGQPGEDYPAAPLPGEKKKYLSLDGEDLAEALGQALRSASTDASRPALCSVFLEPREKDLAVLATDSYRLLLYPLKANKRGRNIPSFLLPFSSVEALQADLAREKPEEVDLSYWQEEGGGLSFSYDNREWNLQSLEGEFPDYNNIIPRGGQVLALDSQELLGALKAAEAIQGGFKAPKAQSSVGALRIDLKEEPSLLLDAPGVGQMEEVLAGATWSGDEMTVGIHPLFLFDMLRVFRADRVWGRVLSPGEPLVFENEEGRTYLTMPVRLPDLEKKK